MIKGKVITAIAALFFVFLMSDLKSQTFAEGDIHMNFGIGAGNRMWGSNAGPAFKFSMEKGMWEVGPGVISLGGEYTIGYFWHHYGPDWDETWISQTFGARAAYHYDWDVNGLDTWAGVPAGFGFGINTYSDKDYKDTSVDFYPNAGFFVGAAYFFKPELGVYGELGYSSTYACIGLVVKL